jgi:peptidyl-prolyl cis-trans isomerase B (cyclophilin B)
MTTSNLKQNIEELKNQIKPLIDTDVISIQKETPFQSGSYNGHLIISTANFENTDNEILELGFATVLINENNRLYSLQYMNTLENYEEQIGYFHDMLTSFEIINTLSTESIQAQQIAMEEWKNDTSSEGGGCLIATAAFGSEMAPQVQFLREIRDNTVMTTQSGTTFMTGFNQFYYSFSPYVADYERENPVFKEAVKVTLTPLLTSLALLNYVDVDTEEEMLGYGIGIILLNIGMYFVAPAAVIIVIKNKLK